MYGVHSGVDTWQSQKACEDPRTRTQQQQHYNNREDQRNYDMVEMSWQWRVWVVIVSDQWVQTLPEPML